MYRRISAYLEDWLRSADRKPLVLRGARQVGKSWAVQNLADTTGIDLVEVNFERNPELGEIFDPKDPQRIIKELEIVLGMDISIESSLLFLDEVQASPNVLECLRWFFEELPQLAVVAAGSLLEFVLEDHDFSMPVGRVTYMFLNPMSYGEFLHAVGDSKLEEFLQSYEVGQEIPDSIHQKALSRLREYCIVGGMPEAVKTWAATQDLKSVNKVQRDLLYAYQDDFNKYRKNVQLVILRKTMRSIPLQLGRKFVYSEVDRETKQPMIKKALELLVNARLCRKVTCTSGNGLPLGAEENPRIFKCIFSDIGLVSVQLGLLPMTTEEFSDFVWANKGAMAEQLVGQSIEAAQCPEDTSLFYWQQNGSGSGEIDYLTQNAGCVLPIEVKAGKSGTMKSLHWFMHKKGLGLALRFDLNEPSSMDVGAKTSNGDMARYRLISLPLYMAEYAERYL